MGKPTRYIVEGANFVATVVVDEDVFTNSGGKATNAYLEAATKVIEYVFRHGPDSGEDFDLLIKDGLEPAVGVIMSICKDGEIGDQDKLSYVKTATAAENAGCLELVRHFEKKGWGA